MRDDLVEKAEAEARRRGLTLEDWMERTVEGALEPRRAKFPIFESKNPGSLDLTSEDIRRMEEDDDLQMLERSFGAEAMTLRDHPAHPTGHRVDFPIIRSNVPGTFRLTNEDIRRMEEEDDLRMLGQLD